MADKHAAPACPVVHRCRNCWAEQEDGTCCPEWWWLVCPDKCLAQPWAPSMLVEVPSPSAAPCLSYPPLPLAVPSRAELLAPWLSPGRRSLTTSCRDLVWLRKTSWSDQIMLLAVTIRFFWFLAHWDSIPIPSVLGCFQGEEAQGQCPCAGWNLLTELEETRLTIGMVLFSQLLRLNK